MRRRFLLKSLLLLCALVAGSSSVWATDDPVTLFHETFGNNSSSARTWSDTYSVKSGVAAVYSGVTSYTVSNVKQGKNTTGKTDSGLNQSTAGTDAYIIIGPLNVATYNTLNLSYWWKAASTNGTYYTKAYYATSSTGSYTEVSGTGTGATTFVERSYSLPIAAQVSTLYLKIVWNTSNTQGIIDEVNLSGIKVATPDGTTADPTISGDTPFLNNTTVTISNAATAEGADIFYTLNGDDPTTTTSATCFAYSAPFTIDETTTVKAIAKKSTDDNASSVVNKTFTKATLLTVAQARAAIDGGTTNDVDFVKGIIAKLDNLSDGALTYWISDNGSMTDNIKCIQGKNIGGAAFAATTDIEVGDIAIVKGTLSKSGNNYQFNANNEVVSITPRTKVNIATFTATTTTLVLGGTTTTETNVTNDQAGWTPVSYSYESDDTDVATVNASGVITAVAKGTANITVSPVVSAADPTYKVGESKSVEITVHNPSHTATFSVNGVTSNISVEEGEAITFPDDPATISGKTFQGWTETAISGNQAVAPNFIDKDNATMDDHNMTFYAVFGTEKSGGADSWIETALADITTSDVFVFSNGSYAIPNDNGITGAPAATSINVSNKEITSTVTDNLKWNVSGNANDGYTFYPNGSTTTWLYCNTTADTKNNDNIRVGTGARKVWKVDNDGYLITNDTYTARYLSIYGTQDFRGYINTSNGAFEPKFYKKSAGITITDYCTTVIPEPAQPTTSGDEVYLSTTANMDGWRSFYDATKDYEVDANTTIYVAAVSETAGSVTLTPLAATAIPHGEAVILKTTDAGHSMTLTETTDAVTLGDNVLTVTDGTNDADGYRLGYKDGTGVAFFKYTATKPSAGIVYIAKANVNTGSTAPEFLTIGGETTGIKSLTPVLSEGEGAVYDLQGRKVAQPTKGLYIVNGRKVVVK